MSDRHRPTERLARQQVESQPAVGAPERFDGQAEVDELIDQHAQVRQRRRQLLATDRVVGVGDLAQQRIGEAPTAHARVLLGELGRGHPVATAVPIDAAHPAFAVDVDAVVGGDDQRSTRQVDTDRRAAVGALLSEKARQRITDGTCQCMHGFIVC